MAFFFLFFFETFTWEREEDTKQEVVISPSQYCGHFNWNSPASQIRQINIWRDKCNTNEGSSLTHARYVVYN